MKENDFIKEHGLGEAVKLVNSVKFVVKIKDVVCDPCFLMEDYALSYKELKRLIESHEIVEKYGGLEKAKDSEYTANDFGFGHKGLKQAIEDVRSCQ